MGVKMFGVLLACVWLVAGSPLHPWPLIPHSAITQGSYIRHYGAAWYDTTALREHRDRSRRDVSASGHPRDATLNLRLHALDRVFKMRLVRDTSLFHEDAVFEGSNGRRIPFDPAHTYTGTLEDYPVYGEMASTRGKQLTAVQTDDENSVVHGIVTKEGLFDGTIVSSTDEIYIEPASRYLHPACTVMSKYDGYDNATDSHDDVVRRHPYQHYHHHHHYHHTIAYRSADVSFPPRQRRTCASEFLRDNELHRARDNKTRNDYTAEDTHSSLYQRPNKRRSRAKPGFYPKDARKKDPTASSHNLELLDKLYRERYSKVLRQRTSVDPKKTICMLYLQADHTFFEHYKSEEACIEVMTSHVQRVNSIYRSTDFNQDGQPDNISFMIKRVKVHGKEALNDPNYRFTGNYGVQEFLELFSEEDYDAFCLSYMFTYRDFKKGTLGLAWSGELTNAAGVCEKNGYYRGSMKSLNTGIITLLNYGKHVPPTISHVTLAHEIGHNFGSPHDPDECSPGGKDGNFIMFAKATSGDKRNNNRFSPCSLASINPVLNAKARSTKGCFAEPQTAICGNGVVEEGEECDCGWEEDCSDPCCHPQRLHHASHEIPCRLADGAVCSPSQGPCCTSGCTLRNGDKCRDDNGCRDASFCDGRGPQCPPSINKPNKTICNEEFVCYMGECTGSICLAYGLESCQCIAGPDDPPTKSCELCCKLPGEDQPCLSSFAWNSAPYDIPDMLSKPGTPCNDYNGYCDVFQRCREVDPSGPLATLRRLFLSDASLASFQRWLIDRWYAVMFVVVVLLAALLALTRLLSKRRISHMRNLSLEEKSSPTSGCLLMKKDFVREGVSARKIRSMDIARIKRRIVETMKSIASPRRKKDVESFDGDTCVTKILRYFEKQAKQDSSKKDETMAERKKQGTESQRRKFESNDTEVPYDRCRRSSDNSVYSDTGEWKKVSLLCLGEHCIGGSRKRAHNVAPSHEETWGKDAPSVERLREPSRLIVSCKTFNNYRTVPLVMPDTPDTPNDTNEARIQTSDLTVLLLPES